MALSSLIEKAIHTSANLFQVVRPSRLSIPIVRYSGRESLGACFQCVIVLVICGEDI